MGQRLPFAATKFQMKQDDFAVKAQAIHDGLVASIATFPTPPILPLALQGLIDDYNDALAAAVDGSKESTAAKNFAKFQLKNALRADAGYVNQIIFNLISAGTSYDDAKVLILGSGYDLSKDPVPAGPLSTAGMLKKMSSPSVGTLYILMRRVSGASGYSVKLGRVDTGEQKTYSFSNTRITITGLVSGVEYNAMIAAIGANPVRNYDVQDNQVII